MGYVLASARNLVQAWKSLLL